LAETFTAGGVALQVAGKARFSTAGSDIIPRGESDRVVANAVVTASSHITVTLTSEPRPRNVQVTWVERQPGVGFAVHLNVDVNVSTSFTYLIVEPGPDVATSSGAPNQTSPLTPMGPDDTTNP
jgi:hypothetical protein